MALTLEVYRSRLPEPEGRWFVVLARNKKGAVHTQLDVTDLFEERFQAELNDRIVSAEQIWRERVDFEMARAENLHDRLQRVLADTHTEAVASARLLQEKEREWQKASDARAKALKSECEKCVQEKMATIHQLQEEVRQKVSQIRALMKAAEKDTADFLAYRDMVNRELTNGHWADEEMLHEGRRQWKLENGHVPYHLRPWYRRWFRKPDQDLLIYSETTSKHKNLCRFSYEAVLRGLRIRLGIE